MNQFVTLIIPFILVPYLIRTLGPENLGIEAYTLSITLIAVMLSSLGMHNYATRLVATNKQDTLKTKAIVKNLLFIKILAFVISSLLFLVFIIFSPYYIFFLAQMIYITRIFRCYFI